MKHILSLAFVFCWLTISAQVSKVSPAKPMVSDTINITYHSDLPQARLKGKETIYARITNYLQDGSIEKFNLNLLQRNGKAEAKFSLPKLAAFSRIEFYTLNREDELANQNLIVYESNGLRPVKGAYFDALFGNNPDSIFKLEIANYPNNYYAYAKYMNVMAMVKKPEEAKVQIERLLKTLNNIRSTAKDIGLMAAICVGNAKIGALTIAKNELFQLFDSYPSAAETAFAFSIYSYEYYKFSNQQIEEDVRRKLKNIFISFPGAAINKNVNVFEDLRKDKDISTASFEKVLMPSYQRAEIPYYALGSLPEIYIERNEKLAMAKSMLLTAIKQYQDGRINHQYRLNNGHYQMYVPLLMLDLAKINDLERDDQAVVIHTSAAIQIIQGSNVEGNFLPLILQLRAKAYTRLGNFNLALEDYKKLYLNGSISSLDSMQHLFPLSNIKQKSFEDFIRSLKPSSTSKIANNLTMAPNFSGTDLNGHRLSLVDLKGKLVVLNVWSVGCGPCVAEIPALNELVKEYATEPNVVFIAVTADTKESLIQFFKTKSFNYKVINKVNNLFEVFNTNALPVHIVIGKNGEFLSRSIGAREDIRAFLKGIIKANL
ncbi:MAG: TlpA disulfide reductase family protein [Bacteroidota bacterium]